MKEFHPIYCIFCLNTCIELACFICIIILCHISSKNPFKNHIIGDLRNYFTIIEENNDETLILRNIRNIVSNYSQIRKRLTLDENDTNMPLENKMNRTIFLRHLVSKLFCEEIKDYFIRFNGRKLSYIFDLNYEIVHKLSIANLVVTCGLIFFYIIIAIFHKKLKNSNFVSVCLGCLIFIFTTSLYIAKLVLSIILFYYIEKGDIEKYDDFLDCPNVKVKFFDKFSEINTLRKCFIAFLILNIIEHGLDKLQKCCDYIEKVSKLKTDN